MNVIDGKNHVLGRLATKIAKLLLKSKKVKVINASQIVITGNKEDIIEKYINRRERGDPFKGPFYPKNPKGIFRRTVKGMLPKNDRGKKALKHLRVYKGTPRKYKEKGETIKEAVLPKSIGKYLTLKDLEERLN